MKFLIFTDLHGSLNMLLNKYQFEQPDLVIILGDLYNLEARKIDSMFDVPILGIHGNHDDINTFNNTSIIDIHNCLAECDEFSIVGLEGSSKYKPTQYYGYDQKESLEVCKQLQKADILISHDGPYNKNKDDAHCGLQGIDWYIKNNKPKLLFYGHHHKFNHFQLYQTDCYCLYEAAEFEIENNQVISYKNFNT